MSKSVQPATEQMSASRRRYWLMGSLVFLVIVVGTGAILATSLPHDTTQATSADVPDNVGFEPPLDGLVPMDLPLANSEDKSITLAEIAADGRPIVLNLVQFECPMLCNMSMDGLVRALNTMQLRVGRDFNVVTVSFDSREKPVLARGVRRTLTSRYQSKNDDGWHVLTASQPVIDALTHAVGFRYQWDQQTQQFAHAAGVVVLTPEGRISRFLSGIDYAARDLRLSLVEAGEGKIGTWSDQAVLLCYRYDPLTGRYGLVISRMIQFLATLTILGLLGGIGLALYRERRATDAAVSSWMAGVSRDGMVSS